MSVTANPSATVLDLDATAQAALIRRRELSPAELQAASRQRVEELNPRLGAVVALLDDIDQTGLTNEDAPFLGVSMLVKDLIATVASARQTEGSRMLKDRFAPNDSELIRRYRAAGLRIFGKTNTSEFGHQPVTDGQLFGPTSNPWCLASNAGGSSGGSAAAVAARVVPVAHGNDAGGSLRVPAACCGVFGFKPTSGIMPSEPAQGPFTRHLVSEHVITRSVRDSATLFQLTADHRSAKESVTITDALKTDPPALRIGVCVEPPVDVPLDEEQVAVARNAAEQCEACGHHIELVSWPVDGAAVSHAWFGLWADAIGWQVREAFRLAESDPDPALFDGSTWHLYQQSLSRTPLDAMDDLRVLDDAAVRMQAALAIRDVWLTPVLAQPPPPRRFSLHGKRGSYLAFSPFTRLANIARQPSCAMPLGRSAEGLPIGTLFTASRGRDTILFQLAAQLERTDLWLMDEPPILTNPKGAARCDSQN